MTCCIACLRIESPDLGTVHPNLIYYPSRLTILLSRAEIGIYSQSSDAYDCRSEHANKEVCP